MRARAASHAVIDFPDAMRFLWDPARYKVAYGGRGSAKSWSFATALLLAGLQRRMRVLCAREIQNSIDESVHELLKHLIEKLGLSEFYRSKKNSIVGRNGTRFRYAGLLRNVTKLKSSAAIDVCWIEEAETVSEESLRILFPSIREAGSEIWISFNTRYPDDPVYRRFVESPPPDAVVRRVGWQDNPWFPDVLRREMEHDYATDAEIAAHVWGGELMPPLTGRVYHGFSESRHVKPVSLDRSFGPPQLWCDFNVHAMRWLIVQAIPREIRVLDEIALGRDQSTETASEEAARRLLALRCKGDVVVCGDATGGARRSSATSTDYAILRSRLEAAGFGVSMRVPPANPPVLERVGAVNWHLRGNSGRVVVIDPKAIELRHDLALVAWLRGAREIDKSDANRTHASDAFGYGVWMTDRPSASDATVPVATPERVVDPIMEAVY